MMRSGVWRRELDHSITSEIDRSRSRTTRQEEKKMSQSHSVMGNEARNQEAQTRAAKPSPPNQKRATCGRA